MHTRVVCAHTSAWVCTHVWGVYASVWGHVLCAFMSVHGVGVSVCVYVCWLEPRVHSRGFLDPGPHPNSHSGWAGGEPCPGARMV